MTINVGVLAPKSSWHFRDLKRASESFGDLKICSVDFATLSADVGLESRERFQDSSQAIDKLDALVVRTMPRGSLQQIIFRMDVLHRIRESGVQIFNPPRSVEIAIDKYLSLSLMADSDISVPPFVVTQTVSQGIAAWEKLGRDVVLKPIFGSMGKHVHRLTDDKIAQDLFEEFIARGEVLYLQKFIDHGGSDIRILVVGSEIFAMRRVNESGGWLTNVAQGSKAESYTPTEREIELARAAAQTNHCEIAGVDLVYEMGTVDPLVLEVNTSPGWEALQNVCESDVAKSVLQFITTTMSGAN